MNIAQYEKFAADLSQFNRMAVPLERILDCDCTVDDVREGLLALAHELWDRTHLGDPSIIGRYAYEADTDICGLLVRHNLSVGDTHSLAVSARNNLLEAFGFPA
jgi:hypothetical protein